MTAATPRTRSGNPRRLVLRIVVVASPSLPAGTRGPLAIEIGGEALTLDTGDGGRILARGSAPIDGACPSANR